MHKSLDVAPIAADPTRLDTSIRLGGFLAAHCETINHATEVMTERFSEMSGQHDISLVYRDTAQHGIEISIVHSGRSGAGTITSEHLFEEENSIHLIELQGHTFDVRRTMTAGLYKALHEQVLSKRTGEQLIQPTLLSGETSHNNEIYVGTIENGAPSIKPANPAQRYIFRPAITIRGK